MPEDKFNKEMEEFKKFAKKQSEKISQNEKNLKVRDHFITRRKKEEDR